ncbi:hypothetical protein ACFE04_022727 [Oxalis oulophora]
MYQRERETETDTFQALRRTPPIGANKGGGGGGGQGLSDGGQRERHEILTTTSLRNVNLYTYKELRKATEGFSLACKIGEGGFGLVYKGRLKDGKHAAIKVLSAQSRQGVGEFLTEINVISEIEHANLVKLYGCCVEKNSRILVYNYLENNSLAQTLLGKFPYLTLKAFRVCLISDFLQPVVDSWFTWRLYERKELVLLVDTMLNGDFDIEEACRFLKVALLCTQEAPKLRPSMSTVVKMLNGRMLVDDSKITQPGLISDFLDPRELQPNTESTNKSTTYNASSSCSDTMDNSTVSSGMSTFTTNTTFMTSYDQSIWKPL